MPNTPVLTAEHVRLDEDARRTKNWTRWGPYLSERQWGTVREDYSDDGESWYYFTHEQARSRAYRWGEDGLLGITDRECRLCFALALWNGRDPFLKERLFGVTGRESNHGEDVKECYFYLDATPTGSWLRGLYKYPQAAYPYESLVNECSRRSRLEPEYELQDTGIFDENRYWDVTATYAKAGAGDICIEIALANRGPEAATLHVLPTLWFRNTWSWGRADPAHGCPHGHHPHLQAVSATRVQCDHATLGRHFLEVEPVPGDTPAQSKGKSHTHVPGAPQLLFTENDSNLVRLFGSPRNESAYVKDAFHDAVVHGRHHATNPARSGTKCAAHYVVAVGPGEERRLRLRLFAADEEPESCFGEAFDAVMASRQSEADTFYESLLGKASSGETTTPFMFATKAVPAPAKTSRVRSAKASPSAGTGPDPWCPPLPCHSEAARLVSRQAYAGLLWSKQFYHFIVSDWLTGDPAQPPPPAKHATIRNADWPHFYARDVLSMPDKWEYPWFAAWDLAFHMLPMARLDPAFAKSQLNLMLREWYLHPNGQIPAYEWNFSDVNPPVHAWACWRVYKMTAPRGHRDRTWLASVFQKLLLNFTWWVNRKDPGGRHIFSGGFLGLDNIGVFDRSKPLPTGGTLEQADGTAWMAFYCGTMLSIALELAEADPAYEDIASKFFEHFVHIADAMNTLGGTGLWHEGDGFYYDQLMLHGHAVPMRMRSTVGIIPLFAAELIDEAKLSRLKGFARRTRWFLENRKDLAARISYLEQRNGCGQFLLAIPTRDQLVRVLSYVLDEAEFLAPHGVRSLSRRYLDNPFVLRANGDSWTVKYVPGDSDSWLFGGNSNWRGPIWFPTNFLLIEALERYHHFYGDSLKLEFPTGSGRMLNLAQIARELALRLVGLFLPGPDGSRPALGPDRRWVDDPHWRDMLLFHEYFHAETGQGLGASHQTGWTALAATLMDPFLR